MMASVELLAVGKAYTIGTGIGAIGAFIIGIPCLGEPMNSIRWLAAVLMLAGLLLMKHSSSH